MALLKSVSITLLIIFLSACSSLTVNHDYNLQTNFSKYKTYDWLAMPKDLKVDEFNRTRFITAVENNLYTKGFIRNNSRADFKIAVHFGKQNKVDITHWGYSYAPNNLYTGYGYRYPDRYGHAGGSINTGGVSVYEYEEGTLILDFIDSDSKQLIWRATAKAIVNPASTPEKQTERIKNAVNKILEHFPPKA